MRITALIGACCLALLTGSTSSASPAQTAPVPVSSLDCASAVDTPEPDAPSVADVVLFRRVAIRRDLAHLAPAPYTGTGAFRYWFKAGLLVHRHGMPFGPSLPRIKQIEIVVPREWRNRAAIGWGNTSVSSTVRINPCRSTTPWLVFAGGYYVRSSACVPLIVRMDERSQLVRIAVGRPCS